MLTEDDRPRLGRCQAACRLIVDGAEAAGFTLRTLPLPLPPAVAGRAEMLRASARQRHGRTREQRRRDELQRRHPARLRPRGSRKAGRVSAGVSLGVSAGVSPGFLETPAWRRPVDVGHLGSGLDGFPVGQASITSPNYIAMISGSNWWINNDSPANRFDHTNLIDQLAAQHISWGAYLEAMPAADPLTDYWPSSSAPLYASQAQPVRTVHRHPGQPRPGGEHQAVPGIGARSQQPVPAPLCVYRPESVR
ncbi:MAG TPA: hypothetical protein VIV12_10230 [Streptosporangiaceae bacterium]